MNTTETYIKMCEKAKEIQGRKLLKGDYFSFVLEKMIYRPEPNEKVGDYWIPQLWHDEVPISFGDYVIWLPRQDQLQEMVEENGYSTFLLYCFWDFCTGSKTNGEYPLTNYAMQFTSFQQLWLAFVMEKKYGKTWNGEDWE